MTNDERLARAGQAVHEAVGDYAIAIIEARTNEEAIQINRQIEVLILSLQAVADSALDRAEALCGATV